MGVCPYLILRDLLAPEKPQERSLDYITQCLQQHFEPEPIVIAQWFTFHQKSQRPQEPVTEYMAELRHPVTHCKFGNFLSQALCDCFACSLRDSAIQKWLLSERKQELQSALEMAQGMRVRSVFAVVLICISQMRASLQRVNAFCAERQDIWGMSAEASQPGLVLSTREQFELCRRKWTSLHVILSTLLTLLPVLSLLITFPPFECQCS